MDFESFFFKFEVEGGGQNVDCSLITEVDVVRGLLLLN